MKSFYQASSNVRKSKLTYGTSLFLCSFTCGRNTERVDPDSSAPSLPWTILDAGKNGFPQPQE